MLTPADAHRSKILDQEMVSLVVPEYPIGTKFLKKFLGFGVWEGRITSFEGDGYTVVYPDDGTVEKYDCQAMREVIAKSRKITEKNVPVVNRQAAIQSAEKIELSAEAKREDDVCPKPFQNGEHVWVVAGKSKHPAIIDTIEGSIQSMSQTVRVRWTTTNQIASVEVCQLHPMFETENGKSVSSSFSRRERKATSRFAPLPRLCKKGRTGKAGRAPVSAKVKLVKEDSEFIMKSLDTLSKTSGWKSKAAQGGTSVVSVEKKPKAVQRDTIDDMPLDELRSHLAVEEFRAQQSEALSTKNSGVVLKNEGMTSAELESYNNLWDYYLKPTTREGDELPSGMKLRRRRARCNLLRFKNSVFRQKLHAKILRLERSGRKDEIHRLLKAINDHDGGMQSGDGPCQLLEEILGPRTGDDEIEVLGPLAIAALKDGDRKSATVVEDVESDGSIEVDKTSDVENKVFAEASGNLDEKPALKRQKLAKTEGNTIASSVAKEEEVIDLCDDEDGDQDERYQATLNATDGSQSLAEQADCIDLIKESEDVKDYYVKVAIQQQQLIDLSQEE